MLNKPHNLFVFFAALAMGALWLPAAANAQTFGGQPDPVQYVIAPETPGPYQPVTITAQGVGTFLGDAAVTWSLNGAVAKQGVGESTFSFTTAGIGTPSTVRLSIDSASQGAIVHTFTFVPSVINLVWEADTSVPPLYAGHALYSAGSPLRVVAFPTVIVAGKKVAPQSLSYQWSINDTPAPAASGTGKYTLSYTGDQLKTSESVAVDVYFGSTKVGRGEVLVPASDPGILFYNKDPLRGVVWDQALPASIALNTAEITLLAQPYFFANSAVRSGALEWSWTLDGSPIEGPDSAKGLLTLRQTGQGQGSGLLSVTAQNQADAQLIQSAEATLSLVFGRAKSGISSFFGL